MEATDAKQEPGVQGHSSETRDSNARTSHICALGQPVRTVPEQESRLAFCPDSIKKNGCRMRIGRNSHHLAVPTGEGGSRSASIIRIEGGERGAHPQEDRRPLGGRLALRSKRNRQQTRDCKNIEALEHWERPQVQNYATTV